MDNYQNAQMIPEENGIPIMTSEAKEAASSYSRTNNLAMMGYIIYNVALLAFYLIEVINGSRTIAYFAIFAALSLLPLVVMYIVYSKNRDSVAIKYIMAIGYAAFYTFTVFTTISPVAFVYGILISVLIIAYADVKLSSIFGIGMFLVNGVHVTIMGLSGDIVSGDIANIKIRLGFTAVYAVYMILTTRTLIRNNNDKLEQVAKEKELVSKMLENIMNISNRMINDIGMVSDKMGDLENSVNQTTISMEEVTNGTNDTSDSVQTQLMKTEEIQSFIEKVEAVSTSISNDMEDTGEDISLGKSKIDELISQVQISDDASNKAAEALERLTMHASRMQGIVGMIDNITSQTSLLALNASIEAARVGEAGKGFAVVASEITNLADQTQSATVDITEVINNVSAELEEVVNVIHYLIDNNKIQSVAATETASSFETISSRAQIISQQAEELAVLVTELAHSNEEIVESIHTISAATEEVTAHSNETLESSEENKSIVDEVSTLVSELQELAVRLNSIE